jgi:adenosine kinase
MGMGNPLLDISTVVGQDLLDKYDVKLDSAILAEDKHQPLFKELVESYKPTYIAGGATQNTIRVGKFVKTQR